MAQLKDLIVNGASRFIGDIFGNKAQLTTLDAPTAAGGSTYGPGTSGQVLKTNGSSIYWGEDTNTDINVTQTITTTNANYRLLFSANANDTTETTTVRKDTDLRWNPSTNTLDIAANNSNGVIKTTSGTLTINSASTIYINKPDTSSIIFTNGGADTSHEVGRFNTAGNFILGLTSGQNDITNYKLYVKGVSYFNISTNDLTSDKRIIIYGNNRYLSIGGSGLQAYTGAITATTTGTLYLNYNGGNTQVGQSSSIKSPLVIYGETNHKVGHIYLEGSNASSSTNNTTQLVFGTSNAQHIALSSNSGAFIINPSTSSTTGQIVLKPNSTSYITAGKLTINAAANNSYNLYVNGNAKIESSPAADTPLVTFVSNTTPATAAYQHGLHYLVPNMVSNSNAALYFGKAASTGNAACLQMNWIGDNHNNNFLGLGFWATNNLLRVYKTGNVSIGEANNDHKLYIAGNTVVGNGGGLSRTQAAAAHHIISPGGGSYTTSTNVITGALKIRLPVSWISAMMNFTVDIYNYANNSTSSYHIGGYNYSGNSAWYSMSAYSTGVGDKSNLAVRFGHDGTYCCIFIGEINTAWNYPQINVRDVYLGFGNQNISTWSNNWQVSFVTELPTIAANGTITNPSKTRDGTANRMAWYPTAYSVGSSDIITDGSYLDPVTTNTGHLGSIDNIWNTAYLHDLQLMRSKGNGYGKISWYADTYYTWYDYVSDTANGSAPTGGKPGTLGNVTGWARRSLIENSANCGWTWEATVNAAASANTVQPTTRMALSSNDGQLSLYTTKAASDASVIIKNASTIAANTWAHGIKLEVPNLAADGKILALGFGQSFATGNAGHIGFHYAENNSVNNYLALGIWSNNDLIRIYNDGRVIVGKDGNHGSFGIANTNDASGYGISLYNGASTGMPQYGLAFAGSATFGTFGNVTDTWATYFTTSNTTNRGWIFKRYVGTDANTKKAYNSAAIRASDGVYYGGGISLYHPNKNAWCGDFYINRIGTANSGDNNATRGTQGVTLLRVGNNIAWPAAGTAGGDNNSTGVVRIYAENTYCTDIMSQTGSANRTFYLPNYNANMYAVHAGNNNAVGSDTQPVYVAANGRVTPISYNIANYAFSKGYLNDAAYDLNNATTAGTYTINGNYTISNSPGGSWGHLIVFNSNSGIAQLYTPANSTKTYFRHASNNTGTAWGAWSQLTDNVTIDTVQTISGQKTFSAGISTTGISANTVGANYIELHHATPYIDFHHGNSTADFTSRLITTANGILQLQAPASTPASFCIRSSTSGQWSYLRIHNNSQYWDIGSNSGAQGSIPAGALKFGYNGANDGVWITTGKVLMGAAWNDYAEFRKIENKETVEPGRAVVEVGDGTLRLSTKRLERGCEIISDTFGFVIGPKDEGMIPTAATGRVLAYPYESREEFAKHIGWPVCSGPNGTVSIMTEEEEEKYPSRIIGTISEIPTYEIWHGGEDIEVNGRVWIRIR